MEVIMRRARQSDVEAIHEICCEAVEDGSFRLEIDRKDVAYREQWLQEHDKRHPVYVGEIEARVVCFLSLDRYSNRYPYDCVADLSLYVRRDMHNKGLEPLLLKFIEQRAIELGYYKIMFEVANADQSALHAYRGAGYRDVGVLRNHGYERGRLVDVIIMERLLLPNMEFLRQYYSKRYPFYQQYFASQAELKPAADGFRFGAHPAGEPQQEQPADPNADPISQLPEGIVRFLKSKKPLPWQRQQGQGAEPQPLSASAEEAAPGPLPEESAAPALEPQAAPPADDSIYEEDPRAPDELPEGIVRFLKTKTLPQGADPAVQAAPTPAQEMGDGPAPGGAVQQPDAPPQAPPAKKSRRKRPRKPKESGQNAPLEGQLQFEDILPNAGQRPAGE